MDEAVMPLVEVAEPADGLDVAAELLLALDDVTAEPLPLAEVNAPEAAPEKAPVELLDVVPEGLANTGAAIKVAIAATPRR